MRAHFFASLPFFATYTATWFVDFGVPHPVLFAFSWSLATEEQFYWFWPIVLRFARGTVAPLAVMSALVFLDHAAERGWILSEHATAHRIVTSFATPIGLGCIVAILLDDRRGFHFLGRALSRPASGALLLVASVGTFALTVPLFLTHLVFALLVASTAIGGDAAPFGFLRLRSIQFVGARSYGVYLLHPTAIAVVKRVFPTHANNPVWIFVFAMPLAIAFAALAHRTLERPFFGLRKRLRGSAPSH